MTHNTVRKPFPNILLAGMVCLVFGMFGGVVAPTALAQQAGARQASVARASARGGQQARAAARWNGAARTGTAGGAREVRSAGGEGNRSARFYGATGGIGVAEANAAASEEGGARNAAARFFGATSAGGAVSAPGASAVRGSGGSAAERGFTRIVFGVPPEQAARRQNATGEASSSPRLMTGGNSQGPRAEGVGNGPAQITLNGSAPVRYELVGREWVVTGEAPQQRPGYVPPRPAQAPQPIVNPPQRPVAPPPAIPVQNPIRPVGSPANPMSPPIARMPGQAPVTRFPIAQPPQNPIQPIGRPWAPVPPIVRMPGQPVGRFPVALPPVTRGPVAQPPFRRPIGRMRLPGTPMFHPVIAPPGRMPIRRIGSPVTRGPFGYAEVAPPIRKTFDGVTRRDAPFAVMTAPPPHFDAHPCFQTITNCGFGFGFDGDFDFDDGFFFGFPFGSPFFFGPFGFPTFGFGFGPNCFFGGIVEPCAFTPLGFAQFQAFGPNGWGWSGLGWGNGWFYSPPEPPSAPPWNSTETTPGLNLQYFTNEWYVPYSEPEATGAASKEKQQGAEQNPNVITEIVTTDGIDFGVTSYWLEDNQLCYVTTYKIQDCIPMSRVDLQKTVDMNYQRGVKFTLTPKGSDK